MNTDGNSDTAIRHIDESIVVDVIVCSVCFETFEEIDECGTEQIKCSNM